MFLFDQINESESESEWTIIIYMFLNLIYVHPAYLMLIYLLICSKDEQQVL